MVPLRHGSTVRCYTQAVSFEPALESRHSAIYALDVARAAMADRGVDHKAGSATRSALAG